MWTGIGGTSSVPRVVFRAGPPMSRTLVRGHTLPQYFPRSYEYSNCQETHFPTNDLERTTNLGLEALQGRSLFANYQTRQPFSRLDNFIPRLDRRHDPPAKKEFREGDERTRKFELEVDRRRGEPFDRDVVAIVNIALLESAILCDNIPAYSWAKFRGATAGRGARYQSMSCGARQRGLQKGLRLVI